MFAKPQVPRPEASGLTYLGANPEKTQNPSSSSQWLRARAVEPGGRNPPSLLLNSPGQAPSIFLELRVFLECLEQ